MAKDSDQIVVAASGSVYVAPVGTAVQTDPAQSLSATFRELGYVTEDGVTFADAPSVEAIMAWQKATPVRRIVTGRSAPRSSGWSARRRSWVAPICSSTCRVTRN